MMIGMTKPINIILSEKIRILDEKNFLHDKEEVMSFKNYLGSRIQQEKIHISFLHIIKIKCIIASILNEVCPVSDNKEKQKRIV